MVRFLICSIISVSFLCSIHATGKKLKISPERMVVVLPATVQTIPANQMAAKELKKHLKLITGVTVKQVSGKLPKGSYGFFVGVPAPGDETAKFTCDEGRWKVTENGVYFYGSKHNSRNGNNGAFYAVCDFLESQLGVRWIQPGDIAFKKQNPLELETGKGGWKSVLIERFIWPGRIRTPRSKECREFWWTKSERKRQGDNTVEWIKLHRVCRFINWDTRHAFGDWWDKYGKTHPEYFALNKENYRGPIKGTRKDIQLCVSNPDVAKQVITDFLKRNPRPRNINIAKNDSTDTWCRCTNCRKLDVVPPESRHPDQTDRYFNFANRVAGLARKIDPGLKVHLLAYWETELPPKREKVDPNILLTYVPIPTGYKTERIHKILKGWIKAGAKTIRFRPNIQHYVFAGALPLGCEKYIHDLIHDMAKYPQICAFNFDSLQHFWAVSGFADYVLAKSISDPTKPFEYWENHYLDAFGPAKEEMRQYFSYWRENWDKKLYPDFDNIVKRGNKNTLSYFCSGVAMAPEKYYNKSDFQKADAILDKALNNKLSPAEKKRIENFKIANIHAALIFDATFAKKAADKYKTKDKINESITATKKLVSFRRKHKNWHGIPLARITDNEINWGDLTGTRSNGKL